MAKSGSALFIIRVVKFLDMFMECFDSVLDINPNIPILPDKSKNTDLDNLLRDRDNIYSDARKVIDYAK